MLNEFLTNEYTQTIQKVVRQVVNDPTKFLGAKYLPSVALPVQRVYTEVIEANGGLTQEHLPGTNPKYIPGMTSFVQEYQPAYYKEAINYDEKKILWIRELGNNGRNVNGVQDYIAADIDKLNRRIESRIEKQRWDVIFTGGFTFGQRTIAFGVPTANKALPVGPVWSLDGINANPAANPLLDLRYWLLGGLARFRKYRITGIVMNGNTERFILDNPNVRSYLTSYGANSALTGYDINNVLKLLIPGLPPVTVYNEWYQNETVDNDGKVTVSDPIFFIPDGEIYFETSLPGADKIGEFMQTSHLASGSIDNPGFGKFLVIEDNTIPGSKGGPANPYLDILGGVYGGVKLDRAFDVLTARVI